MEKINVLFPKGLPTLEELKAYNKSSDVPPETAWIWGEDDEVYQSMKSDTFQLMSEVGTYQPIDPRKD